MLTCRRHKHSASLMALDSGTRSPALPVETTLLSSGQIHPRPGPAMWSLDCPRSETYSVFWSLDDLCGHGPSLWEDQTSRPSTWLMIGALYARQTCVSSLVLPSARACPPPRVSLLPARPSLDSLASESSIPLSSRHRVSLRPKWLQDEQPPLIKTIKPLRADLSASSFALSLPSSSSRLRTD